MLFHYYLFFSSGVNLHCDKFLIGLPAYCVLINAFPTQQWQWWNRVSLLLKFLQRLPVMRRIKSKPLALAPQALCALMPDQILPLHFGPSLQQCLHFSHSGCPWRPTLNSLTVLSFHCLRTFLYLSCLEICFSPALSLRSLQSSA